jgi:trk system potassium uptake protein TrkH
VSPTRSGRIQPPRRLALELGAALALTGTLVKYLSLAALFPAALAVGYGEPVWPFLAGGALAAGIGLALEQAGRVSRRVLGFREGYLVVSLTWLLAAAFAASIYLLSGDPQLDRPVDAYFESMSGFTTTGASVVTNPDELDRSLLMWRQFTQWVGGMGIIVLALAVLPRLRVGGRQLLESELPGPEVDQLAERIRQTAQRLWLLYLGLTATQALILTLLGWTGVDDEMDLYNAVGHAFTTMPTGGFGMDPRSVEPFSAAAQWVIVVFMVVAGANFALTYRALVRREPKALLRDEELRLYLLVLAGGSALLGFELWSEGIAEGEAAVRESVFQTVSMMTTTGFANTDFNLWTSLALMTLVGLMFVGGSAGSTSGSVKVVRHLLLGKSLRREMRQTVHPELVLPVRLNGVVVDERTLRALMAFVLLYVGIFILGTAGVAVDASIQGPDLSVIDAIGLSATALGNVGPAFGVAGPMGSFAPLSDVSTVVLTGLMWLGRLEVIPIVVLLSRSYWRA